MKPFEPDWMDTIAPLYQFPMGWILMTIALPVENQPDWVAVTMVLIMVVFTIWLLWQLSSRFGQLWSNPETHLSTRMLAMFSLCVVLEFLAIVYVLGKDITSVPRYNFLYFPAVCALLGACLAQPISSQTGNSDAPRRRSRFVLSPSPTALIWLVLCVGVLSSTLVVSNQVFLKPYQPDQIASQMRLEANPSFLVSMAYGDLQDVALGLSVALALRHGSDRAQDARQFFALIPQVAVDQVATAKAGDRHQPTPTYEQVWQNLAALKQPLSAPLSLWVIAPGVKKDAYPHTLALHQHKGTAIDCTVDRDRSYRRGVPYQLYRCKQ